MTFECFYNEKSTAGNQRTPRHFRRWGGLCAHTRKKKKNNAVNDVKQISFNHMISFEILHSPQKKQSVVISTYIEP